MPPPVYFFLFFFFFSSSSSAAFSLRVCSKTIRFDDYYHLFFLVAVMNFPGRIEIEGQAGSHKETSRHRYESPRVLSISFLAAFTFSRSFLCRSSYFHATLRSHFTDWDEPGFSFFLFFLFFSLLLFLFSTSSSSLWPQLDIFLGNAREEPCKRRTLQEKDTQRKKGRKKGIRRSHCERWLETPGV